jgi:toxin CptA
MIWMNGLLCLGASLVLVGVMGYAIQRGATCMVAAVGEILTVRKFRRLTAMIEASFWVLGGLLIGNALSLAGPMPPGYQVSLWTIAGAALLGLGAALNKACVFGAIARFGAGDWSYIATPVGFYLGCRLVQSPLLSVMTVQVAEPSVVLTAPAWAAIPIVLWMLYRTGDPLSRHWHAPEKLVAGLWSPHTATLVIGITYLLLLWLLGPWAYTDFLAELARGGMPETARRAVLLLALLGGAFWGGWTASSFRPIGITARGIARSLTGGAMMGVGSLAIPGGNDGLILTGMPLLWPHAWIALATMCLSIAAYLSAERFLVRRLKPHPDAA